MALNAISGSTGRALVVRYRFDMDARPELHFQTIEGRTLFFCPARVPHSQGQDIHIEFIDGSTSHGHRMRGVVHGHETGGTFCGSWIEFAAKDVSNLLQNGRFPRSNDLSVNIMVRVRRAAGIQQLCRIDTVSRTGARLCSLPAPLEVGESVALTLIGARCLQSELGMATVVNAQQREATVEFTRTDPSRALAELLERAEDVRGVVLNIEHPANCTCRSGTVPFQPPVPRAAYRRNS
jgi:hypothetical protein